MNEYDEEILHYFLEHQTPDARSQERIRSLPITILKTALTISWTIRRWKKQKRFWRTAWRLSAKI